MAQIEHSNLARNVAEPQSFRSNHANAGTSIEGSVEPFPNVRSTVLAQYVRLCRLLSPGISHKNDPNRSAVVNNEGGIPSVRKTLVDPRDSVTYLESKQTPPGHAPLFANTELAPQSPST